LQGPVLLWQIAIDKGWLTQDGLDVHFEWFNYSASIEAFSAGKHDGDFVTNGDSLVMNSSGTRNIMVMLTDYSNGNDMINWCKGRCVHCRGLPTNSPPAAA
jgi:NitT/TauT family transport system substrate-binding protein